VPIEFFPYATPGEMADAAHSGVWNMALLAVEPARQNVIDFSAPYLEIEATYLVPANSPLQHIEDVDRTGVRISVMHKSAYDLYLSRSLKHAQLVQVASMDASFDQFVAQGLEALSGLRPRLVQEQAKLPGSRILDGRFTAIGQAIGVPKGGTAAAAYLHQFVEKAKASGLVAQIIERNGVRGVTVAGPAA
jgi:polar amino acid transport system substrate-binding protein